MIKGPATRLDEGHNWPHPTKSASPMCYFPLMTPHRKIRYHLILSRDIVDQKVLQSD